MSAAIAIILAAIIAGIAYVHGLRSNPDTGRTNTGGYGLGILVLLFAGLWASDQAGNEPAAYGFGIAISLALWRAWTRFSMTMHWWFLTSQSV